MTEHEIKAAQIKRTRRSILDALNLAYPGELSFEDLCAVLPTTEEHYIHRDTAYLVDKGYVQWLNKRPNGDLRRGVFRLTPAGEEIAQRINEDPALMP